MSNDPNGRTEHTTTTRTTTSTRGGRRGTTTTSQQTVYERNNISSTWLAVAGILLVLLVVWLLFPVIGRVFSGARGTATSGAIKAVLNTPTQTGQTANATSAVPAVPMPMAPAPAGPSATFSDFYYQHGGERVLGRPISSEMTINGRKVQWFERARIEQWPEYAGTPYAIQLGRLGVEITQARKFQEQQPFVSRPDLAFFPQTGYSVAEPFLSFWSQNGSLDAFGYPISGPVYEQLSDGIVHKVQYFERARFEEHQQTPANLVQLGLLGTALYTKDSVPRTLATPVIITVPGPTPVPMP